MNLQIQTPIEQLLDPSMTVASPISPCKPSRSPKPRPKPLLSMRKEMHKDSTDAFSASPVKLSGSPVPFLLASSKKVAMQRSPVKQAIDAFEKRARGSPVPRFPDLHSAETTSTKDSNSNRAADDKRPSLATRRSLLLDPLKVDLPLHTTILEPFAEGVPLDETPPNDNANVLEGVPDDVEFDFETIGNDVDFLRRKVTQLEQACTRLREKEALQRRLHGARSRECRALHGQVNIESKRNQSLTKENELLKTRYNELWDECAAAVKQQHLSVPMTVEHKVNDLLLEKYRHEDSHWRKMKAMNQVFGGKRAMSMPATGGSSHVSRKNDRGSGATQMANTSRCFRCGDHRNRRIAIDVRKDQKKLTKADTSARRDNIYDRAEFCIDCFQCVKCDSSLIACVDNMMLCEFGALCSTCEKRPPHESAV